MAPCSIMGPPCVKYIIVNELCERFAYYGLRAALVTYLTDSSIDLSERDAIAVFSYFTAAAYFTPMLGGFISDTYWGRYRTILVFSLIYCCGCLSLALSSLQPSLSGALVGLCFIALGTGGIKPCVSTFGADQFPSSASEDELSYYFHVFYIAINIGSIASFLIVPVLKRSSVGFAAAFGLPALLLLLATAVFFSARNIYVKVPPQGSTLRTVTKILFHAGKIHCCDRDGRWRGTNSARAMGGHWLDVCHGRFNSEMISATKALLRVIPIFMVMPIFWTLFDQQCERVH